MGRVGKCGDYLILSVGVVDHDIEQLQEVSNQIHKQYHVVRFEAPICTPQGAAGEGGREGGGGDGRVSEGWVHREATTWYMHNVRRVHSHLMKAATKGRCGTTPTLLLAWILRHVKLQCVMCEGTK